MHTNARTNDHSRGLIVSRVRYQNLSPRRGAGELGIRLRTVYKWLSRFRSAGRGGLPKFSLLLIFIVVACAGCSTQEMESVRKYLFGYGGEKKKKKTQEETSHEEKASSAPERISESNELNAGEWREKENLGFGFGGLIIPFVQHTGEIFSDINIASNVGIHISLQSDFIQNEPPTFGVHRKWITGALRWFPSQHKGWFIGGGTGYGEITHSSASVESTATVIPVFFDAGWQGWDVSYLVLNIAFGGSITISENDNTATIPDTEEREQAKDSFEGSKNFYRITVGVGWFLF